ncbi:hypothetical protein DFJ58DRAFT_838652 [Suillus subalutaceus]|uniref:uncharacterized protein n=1 Tax=Suillus subalutaceus TaxID=48586 RepID=UPI001B85BB7A|nr:uncharacterized protein DFJ58DRAFT_838652 [Suillus subalutaceus]KAG1865546.1 hypothetical protein DFJ58DRAFT_838652 [Suillus subalutaceus]
MAPQRSTGGRKYTCSSVSSLKVACQYCNELYTSRGLKSHEQSCLRRKEKKKEDREFSRAAARSILKEGKHKHRSNKGRTHEAARDTTLVIQEAGSAADSPSAADSHYHYDDAGFEGLDDVQSVGKDTRLRSDSDISMGNNIPAPISVATATTSDRLDTFKTEYHPHSGHAPIIESFSVYGTNKPETTQSPVIDDEPWQPFSCRADFEFAELAHRAALSKDQTNELLKFIWRVADGRTNFTFKTHNDVSAAWTRASSQLTPFERHVVPVEYKKENIEYEVYSRPLWDWALDLLDNPLLAPARLYKHDGTDFERFFHEPWTGDRWWDLQTSLPHNGAPFAFILYADKTHLSSAGAVKAYPVIARCGNLPVEIRNVDGPGGGRLVGWLPIVPADSDEDGKLSYTNLKKVVWHKSFTILLETLSLISKTGFAHQCYDGILRWLFPLILILSADYEEQCVMALIRGFNSACPCPICLVPKDKLTDHSTIYPTRVIDDAQACVRLRNMDRTADTLHTYDSGLFGDHMFEEVKAHLKTLGRTAEKTTDDQFTAFLRWQNLNHFDHVTNISFSDGNKFLDISKQILYTTQNVLTRKDDEAGYALLRCIASYLHAYMYITFDVHTESTIAAGEAEILVFQKCLDQYIEVLGDEATKNWNFPKVHSMRHIFSDIRAKGAARNFSTRPNEKHHGPIKRAYKLQTNGKDIANQILRLDHTTFVSVVLHNHIDHFDDERRKAILSERELETEDLNDRSFGGHIHLGAPQSAITFAQLENDNVSNRAFGQFRKKLSTFLNHALPAYNIPLPDGKTWLTLSAQDTVQEHQYLKVNYESVVDWKLTTDHLRCNPSFHGRERRDCALVRTQDKDGNNKNIFVCILFMFKQSIGSQTLDLALVQPMDAPTGPQHAIDQDLRLRRLRARPLASTEFITLHSVIRGALLVPDFASTRGDFFLVDYVDSDMFLRSQRYMF